MCVCVMSSEWGPIAFRARTRRLSHYHNCPEHSPPHNIPGSNTHSPPILSYHSHRHRHFQQYYYHRYCDGTTPQHDAIHYSTAHCSAVPRSAVRCHAMPCDTEWQQYLGTEAAYGGAAPERHDRRWRMRYFTGPFSIACRCMCSFADMSLHIVAYPHRISARLSMAQHGGGPCGPLLLGRQSTCARSLAPTSACWMCALFPLPSPAPSAKPTSR